MRHPLPVALLAVIGSFRHTFLTDSTKERLSFLYDGGGDGLKDRTQEGSIAERRAMWAGALLAVLGAAMVVMSVLDETPW